MRIDFDPVKDAVNRAKHGLALSEAGRIDFSTAVVRADVRRDYGEPRWLAYAMIDGRMHMLAFTIRDGVLRAISLRKANAREIEHYG